MKKWCSSYWLYVTYVLGIAAFMFLIKNWNVWSAEQKLLSLMAILLPLHVAEEWKVPGGFHFSYNLLFKSDSPNCYPMNQLTDMITNFTGEIFFIVLLCIGANRGIILAMACFSYMEAVGHTGLSAVMYKKYKSRGKRTIYAPGLVTAYAGFLIAGIIMTYYLMQSGIGLSDAITAVIILIIMIGGMIFVPENLFKSKDTVYAFPSARYFEKFYK